MNVNEIGFMKKNVSTKVTRTLSFKHLFQLHPLCVEDLKSLPVSLGTWGGIGDKGMGMVNVCPGHGWPRALLPSELVLFWIPHCMYDIGHPCSCQCISTHPQIKPLMQGHVCVADFITGDKGEVYLAAITHLESNICHPALTSLQRHLC